MVAVKTGAPMVPMGGSPMGGMPMGGAPQPNNMMSPQMPLQPVPPIGQPFSMQQGSAPIPPNANMRKRFGDSLETMLAGNIRPAAPVASDQMGGMNVFTGQMMNTARPPVAQMRNGGIVRNMRMGGGMNFEPGRGNIYDTYSPPKPSKPNKPTVSSASQIIANQIAQAQKDDRPAPVVTDPVVPMDFGDDNNYTPTSAELNEALKDTAAIGMPDMRRDQSDVEMPMFPDLTDSMNEKLDDYSAFRAFTSKYGTQGTPEDRATILAPGTGGLGSPSIPSITYAPDPRINLQEASFTQPSTTPMNAQEMSFTQPSSTPQNLQEMSFTQPNTTPMNAQEMSFDYSIDPMSAQEASFDYLGLGDPNATQKGAGGGQGVSDTGGDDEDDEELTFLQKLARDFKAIPGNIAYDMKMLGYAGLFGSYENRLKNMMDNGVPKDIAKAWLDKSQETAKKMAGNYPSTTEDGTVGGVGVVDPCPEGMRLDPVAGICVPIEEGEGEDEGPSLDLNRTRDDEFNELDDIMKKIVKPIGESDEVRTMQAGGSVGLNRVADNFLAAMGG